VIALASALLAAALLWPGRGVLARWRRRRRAARRILVEDALKTIQKLRIANERPTLETIAGALHLSRNDAAGLVARLERRGLVEREGNALNLTANGKETALRVIRAHRLFERYLADRTGYEEAEWHDRAERFEHTMTEEEADALARQLGNPTHDPHGDPIPTATGALVPHGGRALPAMRAGGAYRIVHVEDEPDAVYARILAARIHPGMELRLLEVGPDAVRFRAEGREHVLEPVVAANLSVVSIPDERLDESEGIERLSRLRPGERGRIVRISRECRGPERRRLLDLGFLAGTVVEAELRSLVGDPTAYRIRETLIALHREQAERIHIMRIEGEGA